MPLKGRHFGSKSLVKGMVKMMGGGIPVRLTFQVDNGQRVRFWMDKCLGGGCLNPKGEEDGWTPLFSRVFNDWELDLVERFCKRFKQLEFTGLWKIE
ncbi:hypothetical protein CK203_096672 [Vitis vinifera]|uniref:DUF4283 domain-containing protein n=1 Tax=Vitis vinifera TaxID=29760 RepID=A0A438DBP9_VITVI|nr:hypothetical protein CK203_096672 [Vitis vinifera]